MVWPICNADQPTFDMLFVWYNRCYLCSLEFIDRIRMSYMKQSFFLGDGTLTTVIVSTDCLSQFSFGSVCV